MKKINSFHLKRTFKDSSHLLFLIVFLCSCGLPAHFNSAKIPCDCDLVIQNVKIFDSKNKSVLANKTLLINGDSIIEIVDNSQKYRGEKIIEGSGRLVVPGFIDTHMHLGQIYGDGANGHQERLIDNYAFRGVLSDQYLAYGTTTIIDMGQYEKWMDVSLNWQENPTPGYPNLFLTSPKLISSGDRWPYTYEGFVQVADEKEAREIVRKYSDMGINYIKLYKWLRKPEMGIVIDEAQKHNMELYAHTDNSIVTIQEAINLGVHHFEHLFTLVPSVLDMDEYWPKVKERYGLQDHGSIDEYAAKMIFFFDFIKRSSELSNKLDSLLETMANEHVTISTAIHPMASAANMNYPGSYSSWNTYPLRRLPFLPNYSTKNKEELRKAFITMMQVVKEAHDKGVKIRIGTDCRYGGVAMLSEMMLLNQAGIQMEDVLQMATWNGAEAMNIQDNYGSIEQGKKADLVLFDKDPLSDFKNLLSPKTVIKGGELYKKKNSLVPHLLAEIHQSGGISDVQKIDSINDHSVGQEELNELGYELMKDGRVSDAITIFRYKESKYKGVAYNDLLETNTYHFAYHLIRTGKLQDAILLYKYNIELFPGSGYAYYALAEAYMEEGNNKNAIPYYKKAIALSPDSGYSQEARDKLKNID